MKSRSWSDATRSKILGAVAETFDPRTAEIMMSGFDFFVAKRVRQVAEDMVSIFCERIARYTQGTEAAVTARHLELADFVAEFDSVGRQMANELRAELPQLFEHPGTGELFELGLELRIRDIRTESILAALAAGYDPLLQARAA